LEEEEEEEEEIKSLRHQARLSTDMYAWQQLPGATSAKNNSILDQGRERNHSQETFAVQVNESLLSC